MKKIRLVNTEGTSNKFYIMEELPGGRLWRASYGRIEKPNSTQHVTYNSWEWGKKLNEKLKKGYRYEEEVAVSFDDVFAALDALEAQMKAQQV